MKQFFLTICLFYSFITVVFSQWPAVFGTEYYWATPNHTRESYDKGYLLTLDFEPLENTPYGSCIVKADINGNQLWKKEIGNSLHHVEIKGLAIDPENNIYISGGTAQFDAQRDPFIMKLNPCMEVEWCNIYRTPDLDDLANEINYVPELNSLMVNMIYVRLDNNISVMNINLNGDKLWENFYCTDPALTGSLPVGIVNSTIDSSVLLYGFAYALNDSTGYYELSPYWAKISYQGDLIWEKFRLPDTAFNKGVTCEEPFFQDGSLITGLNSSYPDNNCQLISLNYNNGDFEWIKTLHHPDSIIASVLTVTTKLNDNIFTGVQYFKTGFDAIGNCSLQKNDTLGNFLTEVIIPANFTSVIEDICITYDQKLVISAIHSLIEHDVMLIKYNQDLIVEGLNTTPIIYDSLCPDDITSGVIELDCNIITSTTNESINGIPTLRINPNPADDYAVIHLPDLIKSNTDQSRIFTDSYKSDYVRNLTIEVFNIFGEKMLSKPWPDGIKEQLLSASSWKSGLYLVKILNGNRIISSGKLMVK